MNAVITGNLMLGRLLFLVRGMKLGMKGISSLKAWRSGAPALERTVLVSLSLCMSLFSASREQPLATGLPRASSRCLPDGSSSFSCSHRPLRDPHSAGWRRAHDALAKPAYRIAGLGGLVALAAGGTFAALVPLLRLL